MKFGLYGWTGPAFLIFGVALVIVFGICVFSVHAQTNADNYFENVRGELLGLYGSEMVSHAAILLGLVVAFPSIGWRALRRVSYRNDHGKMIAFFLNFFYFFVFASMVLFVFYFVGRTIVWSFVSARLVGATPTDVGITQSNVASSMNALANYAQRGLYGSTFWSAPFIIAVNPPENFIIIFLIMSIGPSLFVSPIVSYRSIRKLRDWYHKQSSACAEAV